MRGKYRNPLGYAAAWLVRERLRRRLEDLVDWTPLTEPRPGCTAVVGMCSRLPDVLAANLRCLASSWPDLPQVIVAVDAPGLADQSRIERGAAAVLGRIPVRFVYYAAAQAEVAERLKLPYVYSWLSWCLAIGQVQTEHILIHDYDALVLGDSLRQRYERFRASRAVVQGISWYASNGLVVDDRLATTFEQFVCSRWLRSLAPIELFNKVRRLQGRTVDLDTTLDAQDRLLSPAQREIQPMDLEQLVHPSQMIHQYTMFRRRPAADLPCFSMPMIPFFSLLGGDEDAVPRAVRALGSQPPADVRLFGDDTRINLSRLTVAQVDWALKQMVQACVRLALPPLPALHAYGRSLYAAAGASPARVWRGDFSTAQRHWIQQAA